MNHARGVTAPAVGTFAIVPSDANDPQKSIRGVTLGGGRPVSVTYFRNGGGIVHAFEASSTTAEDGRGSSGEVSSDVQLARFIARIPADEGVQPTKEHYAMGWVLLSWPNCPNVPKVRSPLVPFQIYPSA